MLLKCFLQNPKTSNDIAYKSYKNKLTHSLRVAKRLYYEKQIEKLKSNVNATWKVRNEILNRNKGKRGLPSLFRAGSREISDPKEIANLSFFTNIDPNIAAKFLRLKNRMVLFYPQS